MANEKQTTMAEVADILGKLADGHDMQGRPPGPEHVETPALSTARRVAADARRLGFDTNAYLILLAYNALCDLDTVAELMQDMVTGRDGPLFFVSGLRK